MNKMIAIRPDSIVEARFDLEPYQNDILDIVFSKITDDNNLIYLIKINDFKKIYTHNQTNIYRDFKRAAEGLQSKGFYLKDINTYFSWFASIRYVEDEGTIEFEIGKKLKQILLDVKRKIYYNIKYTFNFKSQYTKKLYYKLKLYEDTGWRIDDVQELRENLECPESYKKYSLFKKNVLDVAEKEINDTSDLLISYDEIKIKNKVVSLKFKIHNKSKINKIDVQKEQIPNELKDSKLIGSFTEEQIEELIQIAKNRANKKANQFILYAEEITLTSCRKKSNYFKYLKTVLEKDFVFINRASVENKVNYNSKEKEEHAIADKKEQMPDDIRKKLEELGMKLSMEVE